MNIIEQSEISLGIFATLLSVLGIILVIIRTFFKVWNRTSFERVLTPKYKANWENFLEYIFISFIITLSLSTIGYFLGEQFNISGNKWLAVSSLLAVIFIMLTSIIIGSFLFITKLKIKIKKSCRMKNIVKVFLVLTYVNVFFINIILTSYYVDIAFKENNSIFNQLPTLILHGLACILIFTVLTYIIRWTYSELHLINVNRHVYQIAKVELTELNNLFFVYAMEQDVHILSKTKKYIDDDFSQAFVYYIKENILLKYELQETE